ncbi:MAG: hypothetical protein JEZ04_02240 [Spirochaetales bacterium]|nr:hypothetical protein [Spirochaetales bacterium]
MKTVFRFLFTLSIIAGFFTSCDLPEADPPDGSTPFADITKDTELKGGIYTIGNSFYVDALLTISAGSTLKMDQGVWINVETSSGAGRIIAIGTPEEPIIFTSSSLSSSPGDWQGLVIDNNGSVFRYCEFRYADTALEVNGNNVTVEGCVFTKNKTGLDTTDTTSGFSLASSTFNENTHPLIINSSFNLDDSNTFTGNTWQRIRFTGSTIIAARTWAVTSVPIFCSNAFYVDALLTIFPGVSLTMGDGVWIDVEASSGVILASGTALAPIRFTSAAAVPSAGDWSGIWIENSGSVFEYCEFSYADVALDVSVTTLTVEYSTFSNNSVHIEPNSTTFVLSGTNTKD